MQSLPLEAKIIKTKMRIREWYDHWNEDVYISFSGGKDSTVLLHIVRELYPDVPAVFVDTGLEYPEIREFVKNVDNVIVIKPKMNFKEVIEKYGYPIISKEQALFIHEVRNCKNKDGINYYKRLNGNKWGRGKISEKWKYLIDAPFKVSNKCCDIIKKNPIKKYEKETLLHPFIGTLAIESKVRQTTYLKNGGCNAFQLKRPISNPLGFWTEQDILQYIKQYNIPYSSIYGEIKESNQELYLTGEQRTGCMFCMFGCHMEKEPNKFQRMKITHPKIYNYCMNQLGLKEVLEYIKVSYE